MDRIFKFLFVIDEVNTEKGSNLVTVTALDISNIFDRKVIEKNIDTMKSKSVEEFLADTITENFINCGDSLLNISYIDITCKTATKTTVSTNSEEEPKAIKEAEKEITEKMEPENYTSIQEFYTNMIMALVCYIEGNKEKFKAMLIKNDNTSFYKMFNSTCVLYIYKMLQKEEKSGVKHEVPINLVAEFYAGAVISSVTYWIKDSSGMTSQELCDHLIKLIFDKTNS